MSKKEMLIGLGLAALALWWFAGRKKVLVPTKPTVIAQVPVSQIFENSGIQGGLAGGFAESSPSPKQPAGSYSSIGF